MRARPAAIQRGPARADIAAGRWAWTLLASQFAIEPVPVISPLVLFAFPAVLVLAYAIAVFPAQAAARTQPAVVLRAE
jgi:hypothetical protein